MPDPNFSTLKVPNPEDPSAFTLAIKLADEVGADAIFGTDPDCDRLGVAVREKDGGFRLLTGNQIGCLMLNYILSGKKELGTLPTNGAAVKSIVSTELARPICAAYGVELFDTLTGFKFIGEKIQQFEDEKSHTFLFGFEESYGFLSSTFVRDKDGVNASLLIAEAAAYYRTKGKTLCDVMKEIFQTYGYYLEHVESTTLPGIDGLKVMGEIMTRVRENPAYRDRRREGGPCEGLSPGHGYRSGHGHCGEAGLSQERRAVLRHGGRTLCVRPSQRHRTQDQAVRQRQRPGRSQGQGAAQPPDRGIPEAAEVIISRKICKTAAGVFPRRFPFIKKDGFPTVLQ